MKKFLKIVLIALGILFLLILIAAVSLALAVRDTTDNTVPAVRDANVDLETLIHREAVKALKDADEKEDVALLLDEYAMNELLYAAVTQANIPLVKPVGAYAAYAENGALRVEIPIKIAGIVPTCIKASVKISYLDQVLKLTVESASVGHFSCTSGIVRALVLNDGNGKSWQKSMNDAGICGTLDVGNLTMTMTSAEIAETIGNLTKDDPNRLLYALVSDLCLNSPDLLEFSFGENQRYGVTVHADLLRYDPATDGEMSFPLDLGAAANSTAALIGNGVTAKNVSPVFHYYTSGYNALGDAEKEAVDALGLSKDNGMGVRSVSPMTMAMVLADQASSPAASITNLAPTLTVTERQMNTIFAGLDVIGAGTAFCYGGEVAYLALESVELTLEDQKLQVCVVFNLNGKRLCGHVATDCPDSERMALDAQINELRLGKKVMSEARTSLFLQYLNSVLESQNWISANAETATLTLDLEAALRELSEYAALLKLNSHIHMQCRRGSSQGQLQLVFHLI